MTSDGVLPDLGVVLVLERDREAVLEPVVDRL